MKQTTRMTRVLGALLLCCVTAACERAAPSDLAPSYSETSAATPKQLTRKNPLVVAAPSALVTHGNGDVIRNGAQTLYVPAGAVQKATLFAMHVPGGERIAVELTATSVGSTTVNDAGARGFAVPVLLCFDMNEVTGYTDRSRISVAEMVNGGFLKVRTIDYGSHICGELPHFSGYTMIEN